MMFIVAYHSTTVIPLCAIAGGLLHYFMLVTFAIMAAEAVNLYMKLVQVLGCTAIQQRYVLKSTLISWSKCASIPFMIARAMGHSIFNCTPHTEDELNFSLSS